jgi:hypothetical protein
MTENPGTPHSPGTPGTPRRIRAGDTDRDRVVAALQGHREAGRLTPDEFEERMEAALRAVWLDELPGLLADLPGDSDHGARHPYGHRSQDHYPYDHHPYDHQSDDRRPQPPRYWPFAPVAACVAMVLVVGSVAAVAHGHFPFPLLWLAVLAFWFGPLRPWGRWRRWGRQSAYRDTPWSTRRRT